MDLLAGLTISSDAELYNVFSSAEEMQEVLGQVMDDSTFCPAEVPENIQNIVTLSTCTYEFQDAKFLVHGYIVASVPVSKNS